VPLKAGSFSFRAAVGKHQVEQTAASLWQAFAADVNTADYVLSSFDPEGLLKLLAERFEASTSDDG
jgi:hypothetical protein